MTQDTPPDELAGGWTADELGRFTELEAWLAEQTPAATEPNPDPEIEPIDIGGHRLTFRHGVGTQVEIIGADGGQLASIIVPTDLMPEATEDDIKQYAMQHYADTQTLAAQFDDDEIARTVADFEETGLFRAMVDTAAAAIRDGLSLTSDDGASSNPDDPTPAEFAAVAAEATELARDEAIAILERVFLTGETAAQFKATFARDVLTTAWAWVVADARAEAKALEAMHPHRPPLTPKQFDAISQRLFGEGSYVARAMLQRAHSTPLAMVDLIVRGFAEVGESFTAGVVEEARARRARAKPDPPKRTLPATLPGFRPGGAGTVPNDRITRGLTVILQQAADGGWLTGADGRPYAAHVGDDWSIVYSPAEDDFPTADVAWEAVRHLDDDTADTAMVALAQWLANHQRDPITHLASITPHEILAQRGTPKHHKGGYRASDKLAVARQMNALGGIWIEGRGFEATETDTRGKQRRVMTTPEGRFLVISTREKQQALSPTGEPLYTRFYYRPGDWAYTFMLDSRGARETAQMMQIVLAYDSKRDRYPKRLGRYLTWQYRVRAHTRTWQQPYTIKSLLDGAGLTPKESDIQNPGRLRKTIQKALDDLTADGVIGAWSYSDLGDLPPRGWLERWLTSHLIITPPAELIAEYSRIRAPRRRNLTGGKTATKRAS